MMDISRPKQDVYELTRKVSATRTTVLPLGLQQAETPWSYPPMAQTEGCIALGAYSVLAMIYRGRRRTSVKTLARYSPTSARQNNCTEPSSSTTIISDVQP